MVDVQLVCAGLQEWIILQQQVWLWTGVWAPKAVVAVHRMCLAGMRETYCCPAVVAGGAARRVP